MEKNNSELVILHFNDVYSIEEHKQEPVGGIARFKAALDSFQSQDPLTLFSGDLFSPSTLADITHGEHMITPMNEFRVDVACLGNHDFDIELDNLRSHISKCNFPWLLSNVVDPTTNQPFGGGKEYHILNKKGYKIGFIGLAEYDWLALLQLPTSHLIYEDFVLCAERLTKFLREEQGCDIVIALTHMRNHNDEKLAQSFSGLDLILGGHDHVRVVKKINDTYYIKSGCEFREFSKIILKPLSDEEKMKLSENEKENIYKGKFLIEVENIEITKKWNPDVVLEKHVELYHKVFEERMGIPIGRSEVDLETSFSKIRTSEQNLPNFIADVIRACLQTDVSLLNTGTIRSDCVFEKGILKLMHLKAMVPCSDSIRKIQLNGAQLHKALENGVSKYPAYEGRFPAVSGMRFSFFPNNPPFQRIPIESVVIEGRGPLNLDETYTVAVRNYLAKGKDGYESLLEGVFLDEEDNSVDINTLLTKFFGVAHSPEAHDMFKKEGSSVEEFPTISHSKQSVRQKLIFQVHHLIHDIVFHEGKPYLSIFPKIEERIKILHFM